MGDSTAENKFTVLHDAHVTAGAKMVPFAGYDMPVSYSSQLEEHHQVRKDAGVFDVSHMCNVDVQGSDAKTFLRRVLANDVARMKETGRAIYGCMLNENGGVIDDLITYYIADDYYRLVVNAGTRDGDIAWLRQQAEGSDVTITERADLSMIAVQGPNAREKCRSLLGDTIHEAAMQLKRFSFLQDGDVFVARTGYTGEDGFEIVVPNEKIGDLWNACADAGIAPIGLGARDTLRLEAGLHLYGNDMDQSIDPINVGLGWTVWLKDNERDFIGRNVVEPLKNDGAPQSLYGLVLEDKGVLRGGYEVDCGEAGSGIISSGGVSPSCEASIALARLPSGLKLGSNVQVQVRKRQLRARIVAFPFIKNGKSTLL